MFQVEFGLIDPMSQTVVDPNTLSLWAVLPDNDTLWGGCMAIVGSPSVKKKTGLATIISYGICTQLPQRRVETKEFQSAGAANCALHYTRWFRCRKMQISMCGCSGDDLEIARV